jgi:hypothetical protein
VRPSRTALKAPSKRPTSKAVKTPAMETAPGAALPASRLWTIGEVAEYLAVTTKSVRRFNVPRIAIVTGEGRRALVRYDPAEVKAWVELRKSRMLLAPTPDHRRSRSGL